MKEIDLPRIQRSFFSKHWSWQIGESDPCEKTAGAELARRLPHIEPESWGLRFALGGAYVAGRPAAYETPVEPPCRIEYYEPLFDPSHADTFYPQFDPGMVIVEDGDIGVAYKPPGLPSTPARDQQRFHMQGFLEAHFQAPIHLPSRLDTGVAGLLIFSRSMRGNRWCQKAQERRLVEKTYLCEVSGSLESDCIDVARRLCRDERHPVLRRTVDVGGEEALTKLCVLGRRQGQSRSLVQARPITGRTHQIRVHCAAEGVPIVGDPLYGGADGPELRLVSYAISFFHPFQQRQLRIELPDGLRAPWLKEVEQELGPVVLRKL